LAFAGGKIEIKKIWGIEGNLAMETKRLFLLDIDVTSKKVAATYGPFQNDIELNNHAAFLGIKIKKDI